MALTPRGERFPGWLRLVRKTEYDSVYQGGRKCVRRFLVVHALARPVAPTGQPQPTRLGMSVSRKTGGAVQRNRIRRRLREFFRREHSAIAPGHDLVVTARTGAANATYQQLAADFRSCLHQHGLLSTPPPPESASPSREPSGAA